MTTNPKPELAVAYWTIAGRFPGIEPEYSRFDFKERVEAAARAGFCGLGIWHADLEQILQRQTLPEMKQILADNGMKYLEVEFLVDWFMDGELRAQSDLRRKKLLVAAEALRATQIKVGDFYQRKCSLAQITDAFATLCREAKEHGTRIAFEPMAVSMINSLEDCLALIDGSGAANGGIILDLWHVVNLEITYENVARWPAKYLFGAEIEDGSFDPTSDTKKPIVDRTFCGEGEFDIDGFIQAINKTGYPGPWGVEIFSQELVDKPLNELATRSFKTASKQIEKGRLRNVL
ncbi:MAG TPA: sugar phosphate isomerase/epimerase family protein [Terriglobales bacterium]|nr:sugar phosphate isomerase/epimerase family protein [Terriglobales bacterium]